MKKSLLLHVFGKSHSLGVVIPVAVVVQPGKAVVAVAGGLPKPIGHALHAAVGVVGGPHLPAPLLSRHGHPARRIPAVPVLAATPVSRIPL